MSAVRRYLERQEREQSAAVTDAYVRALLHSQACTAECANPIVDGVLPHCEEGVRLWGAYRDVRDAAS